MTERPNHLYYGDNLAILRDRIPDESVDLIYLDPPFNSNATYNVLFKSHDGKAAAAQIQAFDDTWHWNQQTEKLFLSMIGGGCHPRVADALTAMRNLLGTSDVNAYLVMMTARLVELHRVLKPTGSLYLHCDPTASHYLKIMLDAIFGPERFQNEIVWKRTTAHNDPQRFGRVGDRILFYAKSNAKVFQPVGGEHSAEQLARFKYQDHDGRRYKAENLTGAGATKGGSFVWRSVHPGTNRHWAYKEEELERLWAEGRILTRRDGLPRKDGQKVYLDEADAPPVQDIWTDIRLGPTDSERLGYPTQKPVALLERIIAASSNEGDVVLDPFCGCGTTIDAAEKLHRRWIGIDVTYLAVDLIRKRLRHTYGDDIENTYTVHGVPADLDGARALFDENPFDFERWAVSLIDAQPNEKQVGDKGIDGRVRFYADKEHIGQALVSVKGGTTVNPAMVRDLRGTIEREGAELGILVTLTEPTRGMIEEADKSGTYTAELTGQTYPKIQLLTIAQLMDGARPRMPAAILPYLKAKPRDPDQLTFGGT